MFGRVTVPPGEVLVVSRLGRPHRALESGTHFVLPYFDAVVARYPTTPLAVPLAATCRTRDGRDVRVEGTVSVQVLDPLQAWRDIPDHAAFAAGMAANIAAGALAARTRDEARYGTAEIEKAIVEQSAARLAGWAVDVGRPAPVRVTACALARIDTSALLA